MTATVKKQGKCIVEHDDCGYHVMTPGGEVRWTAKKTEAEEICKAWFKRHVAVDGIGIGEIEWRY